MEIWLGFIQTYDPLIRAPKKRWLFPRRVKSIVLRYAVPPSCRPLGTIYGRPEQLEDRRRHRGWVRPAPEWVPRIDGLRRTGGNTTDFLREPFRECRP